MQDAGDGALVDWHVALGELLRRIVRCLKDRALSPYYSLGSHGSPWESANIAEDEGEKIVAAAAGTTWDETCEAVLAKLAERRQSFRENDLADPDGYVCNALREFIEEVESAKARGYAETMRRLASMGESAAPQAAASSAPQAPPGARARMALGLAIFVLPLLTVLLFIARIILESLR